MWVCIYRYVHVWNWHNEPPLLRPLNVCMSVWFFSFSFSLTFLPSQVIVGLLFVCLFVCLFVFLIVCGYQQDVLTKNNQLWWQKSKREFRITRITVTRSAGLKPPEPLAIYGSSPHPSLFFFVYFNCLPWLTEVFKCQELPDFDPLLTLCPTSVYSVYQSWYLTLRLLRATYIEQNMLNTGNNIQTNTQWST